MVRFKNRYVLCEIIFNDGLRIERTLNGKDIVKCVRDIVVQLHGDYGISVVKQSLDVKYLNPYTKTVMIRCPRDGHTLVTSSLPMVKKIGPYDAQFNTLHLSGSIRCCQKFLIKYAKKELLKLLKETKSTEERSLVEQSVINSFMVDNAEGSVPSYYNKHSRGHSSNSDKKLGKSKPLTPLKSDCDIQQKKARLDDEALL